MLKYLIVIFFFITLLSCDHPDSKNKTTKIKREIPDTELVDYEVFAAAEIEENNMQSIQNFDNYIPMEINNGVRYVWIEINGIKLKFIFDTGASSICISTVEAILMLKQGLLYEEDIIGTQSFQDATGKISEGTKVNLREVKVGNVLLQNIEATVIDNLNAPLLLGQSAFEKFGRIEIDNINNIIIFKK